MRKKIYSTSPHFSSDLEFGGGNFLLDASPVQSTYSFDPSTRKSTYEVNFPGENLSDDFLKRLLAVAAWE